MKPSTSKQLSHLPRDWMRKVRRAARKYFLPALVTGDNNRRLPAALFLYALRQARPGERLRLFRLLAPYLFAPPPVSPTDVCEINSLGDFEAGYARLAVMLGHPDKAPPPGEIEFLRFVVSRPAQYPGTLPSSDYFFLTAFVSLLAPHRVVEIGTLTGFSAAIIAAALRRQSQSDSGRWVDTIDIAAQCFIDPMRPTGFEIADAFPDLVSMIRLHVPHDATLVSQLARPDELELAFIDADHQHPLPLLDLLRLAPSIKPGGWVVLHDIQLGSRARAADQADPALRWGAAAGAELVFESWPFRKISGGNIGAVQLPDDKSALIPFALRLISMPFEIEGRGAAQAESALHRTFAALLRSRP